MSVKQKLELTWVGKGDEPQIEPRILLRDKTKEYGDPNNENMLIHGDNLLALKALEQKFAGKIKCIYIDPPYNTGSAFEHYDDNLEHSTWLSLMAPRLKILRNLLREDGFIIIHIDETENAYLKVLCDEIFGRKNYVNTITVRDSHPSGLKLASKEKTIIKTKSHMIIYKKSVEAMLNPIYQKRDKWDNHFGSYINIDDEKLLKQPLREVLIEKKIISNEGINESIIQNKKFREFVFANKDKIFQSTKEIPEFAKQQSLENPDKVIEYSHNEQRNFAFNGRRLSPLSKSLQDVGLEGSYCLDFAKLLCDFWDDIDFNNSQNEGGVLFPASKKPEYLVARIFTMFSSKHDLVLDSFLGSGTTAAVAHKMGRRWIGIELGDHCYTHCIPRMEKVILGEQGGISKAVNWRGGGGFQFYELAPTLIERDRFGVEVISGKYDGTMLAMAVARLQGFVFQQREDRPYIHGVNNLNNGYIYVTTAFVTETLLNEISRHFSREESLLICANAFELGLKSTRPNIKLKKIPECILRKCEYGVDNYNLNIIDLSKFDEEDGNEWDE